MIDYLAQNVTRLQNLSHFKGSTNGSSLLLGPGHFANYNGVEYLTSGFTFYWHMESVETID